MPGTEEELNKWEGPHFSLHCKVWSIKLLLQGIYYLYQEKEDMATSPSTELQSVLRVGSWSLSIPLQGPSASCLVRYSVMGSPGTPRALGERQNLTGSWQRQDLPPWGLAPILTFLQKQSGTYQM